MSKNRTLMLHTIQEAVARNIYSSDIRTGLIVDVIREQRRKGLENTYDSNPYI